MSHEHLIVDDNLQPVSGNRVHQSTHISLPNQPFLPLWKKYVHIPHFGRNPSTLGQRMSASSARHASSSIPLPGLWSPKPPKIVPLTWSLSERFTFHEEAHIRVLCLGFEDFLPISNLFLPQIPRRL